MMNVTERQGKGTVKMIRPALFELYARYRLEDRLREVARRRLVRQFATSAKPQNRRWRPAGGPKVGHSERTVGFCC